ncbi:MAG: hypothetical protein M3Y07_13855 [Acidobacteriota bacterium]|nr:hypothetical protein [Acidobacteriota bacterium]
MSVLPNCHRIGKRYAVSFSSSGMLESYRQSEISPPPFSAIVSDFSASFISDGLKSGRADSPAAGLPDRPRGKFGRRYAAAHKNNAETVR